MKVEFGDYELFKSETFLVPLSETPAIVVGDEEGDVSLVFRFETDKNKESSEDANFVETELVEDDILLFKLVNWNNPLGTSLQEPLHIGTLCKRDMYIIFNARIIHSTREMTVSIYLGGKV